jgi:hypothetical protein
MRDYVVILLLRFLDSGLGTGKARLPLRFKPGAGFLAKTTIMQ